MHYPKIEGCRWLKVGVRGCEPIASMIWQRQAFTLFMFFATIKKISKTRFLRVLQKSFKKYNLNKKEQK